MARTWVRPARVFSVFGALVVATAVVTTGFATDYYYTDTNAKVRLSESWADAEGNHPAVLFAPGDNYFLLSKTYWDNGVVFSADSLNLGGREGVGDSTCSISGAPGSGYGIANLHIWGSWGIRPGGGESELGGKITVENTGGYDYYYDGIFTDRSHTICPDNGYVYIKNSKSTIDGSKVFFRAAGDYSEMRGYWYVTGGSPTLVLESPTAFGAADSTAAYGIRVNYGQTMRFAISNGVELVGTEGKNISLRTSSGKGSPILELRSLPQFDADDYTVPVDIVKEKNYADAIVNKVESGRVTLAKACEVDQLNVNAGTLALAATATLKDAMRVTIAEGARLSLAKGGNFRVASLTVGGSSCATGVYTAADLPDYLSGDGALQVGCTVPTPLTVSYDSTAATATPVDLSGASFLTKAIWKVIAGGDRIPVALSKKISLPQETTNRLTIAFLPISCGFTAEDFVDVSPTTYGLPRTWFETKDENGKTVLTLVVKPVMKAIAYKELIDKVVYDVANDAEMWTDGKAAHPGADYYNDLYLKSFGDAHFNLTGTFPGDSYTVAYCHSRFVNGGVRMNLRLANQQGNTKCQQYAAARGVTTIDGTVFVDASCQMAKFEPWDQEAGVRGSFLKITADISGPGPLQFAYQYTKSRLNELALLGDNSGFSGPMNITGLLSDVRDAQIEVTVTNGVALGGARPAMDPAGVLFSGFPKLIVEDDAEFAAENRCWASLDGLQIVVTNGATCTVRNPYYASVDPDETFLRPNRCAIEKTGAGTLALTKVVPSDAEQNPVEGNGRNDLVRVKDGGLMALAADTFAGCVVEFEAGTSIVVDPGHAMTAATGMVLDRAPRIATGAKVSLVPAFAEVPSESGVTVPFLSVPASTPDLTGVLVPRKIVSASGTPLVGTLQKGNATVCGQVCTLYSAVYRTSGCVVIFR